MPREWLASTGESGGAFMALVIRDDYHAVANELEQS